MHICIVFIDDDGDLAGLMSFISSIIIIIIPPSRSLNHLFKDMAPFSAACRAFSKDISGVC